MILVGFCCVLGAIGLLVAGLAQADPDLVWASIVASAVGGLAVGIAAFQRGRTLRRAGPADPAARAATVATTVTDGHAHEIAPAADSPDAQASVLQAPAADLPAVDATVDQAPDVEAPDVDGPEEVELTGSKTAALDASDFDAETGEDEADDSETGEDPADEPGKEDVDTADLLLIVELSEDVLVVDLRPRYHLAGCGHLDGREAIPLPVNEAREDGFTPCGLCRPDATLAGRARRLKSGDD